MKRIGASLEGEEVRRVMSKTAIPCQTCMSELLLFDVLYDDYVCPKCGPFQCIVSQCHNYATKVDSYVCDNHACPNCNPSKKKEGDEFIFFGEKLHLTNLPTEYQELLKATYEEKEITCPSEMCICLNEIMGEASPYERSEVCRRIFKRNDVHNDLCATCWRRNVCRGEGCSNLIDLDDPLLKEAKFCKEGNGKCYTLNSCGICTLKFPHYQLISGIGSVVNPIANHFCKECRATHHICENCKAYAPIRGSTLFSTLIYSKGTRQYDIDRCIYCIAFQCMRTNANLQREKIALLLCWRLMIKAVETNIIRNSKLSERMTFDYAHWYFMHRDMLSEFDLDDLVHNSDANAIMPRIMNRRRQRKNESTFALLFKVASLPPHLFLKIIFFINNR